jgi:hypothetical protein
LFGKTESLASNVADPDPHHFGKPDPGQIEKQHCRQALKDVTGRNRKSFFKLDILIMFR